MIAIEDRPYQKEAIAAGLDFLLNGRGNGLIYMPTGSGKSVVISETAMNLDGPCVVFQPSKEILEQNLAKFRHYGFRPSVFSASMKRKQVGDVTLATIGSVWKHPEYFEDFPYAIPDECHLVSPKPSMYQAFQSALPDMRWLGFSASPYRMYSNSYGTELRFITRTRPRIFSSVVHWTQYKELFDAGYLAKLEYYSQSKGFDRDLIPLNSNGSEFQQDALQRHLFKIGFQEKLIDVVRRLIKAGRKHIMVFTQFTDESRFLVSQIDQAAMVTATTPADEREAIARDFRSGEIVVLANVGIYVHGFDFPELDTVVDAGATMSLARYDQKIGRGARIHPDKESCWIVDMVDSFSKFGRLEDRMLYCEKDSKWSIWGRPGGPDQKEQQLTNVYFNSGRDPMACKSCGMRVFYMRHIRTGNSATLCKPAYGVKPNIALKKVGDKTYYEIVPVGQFNAEFVAHRSVCHLHKEAAAVPGIPEPETTNAPA